MGNGVVIVGSGGGCIGSDGVNISLIKVHESYHYPSLSHDHLHSSHTLATSSHPWVGGRGGIGAAMRSGTPPGGPRGILAMEAEVPVEVETVRGVVMGVE